MAFFSASCAPQKSGTSNNAATKHGGIDRRGEKLFKGIHEDAGRKNGVKFPTWEENQSIVLLGITIGYE